MIQKSPSWFCGGPVPRGQLSRPPRMAAWLAIARPAGALCLTGYVGSAHSAGTLGASEDEHG